MSYINQALKKAQKEKDAGRISFIRSIGGAAARGNEDRGRGRQRLYYAALAVIILIAGMLFYVFKGKKEKPHEMAAATAAVEHKADMQQKGRELAVPGRTAPEENNIKAPDFVRKEMTETKEAQYKRAVELLKEKQIREAEAAFKQILDHDPGHISSLNDIGALYLHEGRYADAVNHLEKAVMLKPRFATSFYNLACAYAMSNQPEKGMAYLKKAISINKEVKTWAKNDPDLKNLRGQEGFNTLIE